jgi:hypothetical protein
MACSERHEHFDHEPSLNNYCACLSAAGNIGAAFMYSAVPEDKTLQIISPIGTKHYQHDIIRYLPKSQDSCGCGGMLFTATRAQVVPAHRHTRAFLSEAILWLHSKAYGRI